MEQSSEESGPTGLTAKGKQRQFVQHTYIDRTHEDDGPLSKKDEVILKQYDENRVGGAFPLKLHIILKILEKEGNDHIFSWLPHGRAFGIHRNGRFEEEVVKRFFKQSQISSFRRQLNLYGFLRISSGRDSGSYYHEMFLRGKPLLSMKMVRTRIKGTKIRASSSPDNEPQFYSMPFLGPSTRPEYSMTQNTMEQNTISSMNPSMMYNPLHQQQDNYAALFGRMNPSIDFKGGMRGASPSAAAVMNPSFMGQNNGVPSSNAMNQAKIEQFQQSNLPPMMMHGNYMNTVGTNNESSADAIVDRRRTIETMLQRERFDQERREQERIINLMNGSNSRNSQSMMDFRNHHQVPINPMTMRSKQDIAGNGMDGGGSASDKSNPMLIVSNERHHLIAQNAMQQSYLHSLRTDMEKASNMPTNAVIGSSSLPPQMMHSDSHLFLQERGMHDQAEAYRQSQCQGGRFQNIGTSGNYHMMQDQTPSMREMMQLLPPASNGSVMSTVMKQQGRTGDLLKSRYLSEMNGGGFPPQSGAMGLGGSYSHAGGMRASEMNMGAIATSSMMEIGRKSIIHRRENDQGQGTPMRFAKTSGSFQNGNLSPPTKQKSGVPTTKTEGITEV